MNKVLIPEVLVDDVPRPLTFSCYRIYDMKRYTANPKTDAFIVGYHLQRENDTHTLCGYKTDTWKLRGRWALTSLSYYSDGPSERDTMCFRCLRIWSIKNNISYPRQWMIDRISPKERESRKITIRGEEE